MTPFSIEKTADLSSFSETAWNFPLFFLAGIEPGRASLEYSAAFKFSLSFCPSNPVVPSYLSFLILLHNGCYFE